MIIFLYGEDTFRSRLKLKKIKEKFIRDVDPGGHNLILLNGEKISIGEINEAIAPNSLLAKKRMVIIENLFTNKRGDIYKELYNYLIKRKKIQSDNIIVLWDELTKKETKFPKAKDVLFKYLINQKYTQEFELLSNTEVIKWAAREIKQRGGKISQRAAQLLTSLLGSDLWQIDNEINKLISYKQAKQSSLLESNPENLIKELKEIVIEEKDVEELVRGNFDENIFSLTDAISNKNKALALNLLEEQIRAGLTESYLFAMIVRQFRILLQIREALELGLTSRKMINSLKLHPFIVQKGIIQVRKFSSQFLINIINELLKIDYSMKTGKIDLYTNLNLLIVKM